MNSQEEAEVVTKVGELMESLDQVKKYRKLSNLIMDFGIIVLSSVAILWGLGLAADFYRIETGFGPIFTPLSVTFIGGTSTLSSYLLGLSIVLVPAAGLVLGLLWVDREMKRVKVGEWKDELNEGFPAALKLLQDIDWDSVFQDIGISRVSYALYEAIKLSGYWFLSFILLFFPYSLAVTFIHANAYLSILAIISLVLVLVMSRNDLRKRYQQMTSLDSLMWELRWFNDEFRSAEFEA